ncbi:hypothetical protein Tco_1301389 [Tanacetum coccineum]
MQTQREAQQANELSNLTRQRQLLASVNYRHVIIEELELLPRNLVAYKTREDLKHIQKAVLIKVIEMKKELRLQELKGMQKDDMIRAMEMRSTALQLHHQAMKGFDFYKSL